MRTPTMEQIIRTSALALAAALVLPAQAWDRELSTEVDAEDLERVYIAGSVGSMEVDVSDDDRVYVRVTLEPQDDVGWRDEEDAEEAIEGAELDVILDDERLRIDIDYPRGTEPGDDVEETWEIRVPARLMGRFSMNVGSLDIRGIAGGVDASVNVGELEIDVPGGDIEAEVNVGEVDVFSRSDSIGEIDVDTDVGGARLSVNGRRIDGDRGWVGESIRYDGDGDDDIEASSNVGDVSVRVGN